MYNDKLETDTLKKELSQCILNWPLPKWNSFLSSCKGKDRTIECSSYEWSLLSADLWISKCIQVNEYAPIKKCINNLCTYDNLIRNVDYYDYIIMAWYIDDLTEDIKSCIYIN